LSILIVPTPKPRLPIVSLLQLIVVLLSFDGLASLGRPYSPILYRRICPGLPIFIWILEGIEANQAPTPAITTPTPSYGIPPRIRMVWLIVVFDFLFLFPFPSLPLAHFLPQNHTNRGFLGQLNDPRPSLTGDNCSPPPIDCCVMCFGGRWVLLDEAEPPKPPEVGRQPLYFGRKLAIRRSIWPHSKRYRRYPSRMVVCERGVDGWRWWRSIS